MSGCLLPFSRSFLIFLVFFIYPFFSAVVFVVCSFSTTYFFHAFLLFKSYFEKRIFFLKRMLSEV